MIGKTVSHYKILNEIGSGGMGVVYKAEDTHLKREVALKFLPLELTRDKESKERFILEAQSASSLQHHNICTIHEINKTDAGQLFICMDYYKGETLKERICRGALALDETVDISIQILSAVIGSIIFIATAKYSDYRVIISCSQEDQPCFRVHLLPGIGEGIGTGASMHSLCPKSIIDIQICGCACRIRQDTRGTQAIGMVVGGGRTHICDQVIAINIVAGASAGRLS